MYDYNCAKCGGLVPEPMKAYHYVGRYCHCETPTLPSSALSVKVGSTVPMTTLEQIIARQEEEFKEKFGENYIQIICEDSEADLEAILNWHSSSIKEILEGAIEIEKEKLRDNQIQQDEPSEANGYREAKSDTINHLEKIIKKLNGSQPTVE